MQNLYGFIDEARSARFICSICAGFILKIRKTKKNPAYIIFNEIYCSL